MQTFNVPLNGQMSLTKLKVAGTLLEWPLSPGTSSYKHTTTTPWKLQPLIQELQNLANQCEYFQGVHVYREGYSSVDFLSMQSHRHDIIQNNYTYNQLPNAARNRFLLERMGIQKFKRNKLRRIKQLHWPLQSSNFHLVFPNQLGFV